MFGFGKKKEKAAPACACNGTVPTYEAEGVACGCSGSSKAAVESVKVLGSGCKSCHALFESTQTALKNMGLAVQPEYVTDMTVVAAYGVMSTPALVVNEQVVSMGRVLNAVDVERLLKNQAEICKETPSTSRGEERAGAKSGGVSLAWYRRQCGEGHGAKFQGRYRGVRGK